MKNLNKTMKIVGHGTLEDLYMKLCFIQTEMH